MILVHTNALQRIYLEKQRKPFIFIVSIDFKTKRNYLKSLLSTFHVFRFFPSSVDKTRSGDSKNYLSASQIDNSNIPNNGESLKCECNEENSREKNNLKNINDFYIFFLDSWDSEYHSSASISALNRTYRTLSIISLILCFVCHAS